MRCSFGFAVYAMIVSTMLPRCSLAFSRLETKIQKIPPFRAVAMRRISSSIEDLRNLYLIEEQTEIDDRLNDIVEKNAANFCKFVESRSQLVHPTSYKAFKEAAKFVDDFYILRGNSDGEKLVIIDSGCGQGLSTVTLSEKYPNIPCIGIDRSITKLNNNRHFSSDGCKNSVENIEDKNSNMLLIQGELTDFWQLVAFKSNWKIYKHFIIHPNPSPKHKNIKQRFYAHSIFPVIPLLGGELFLRSNWRTYATEFLESLKLLQSFEVYDKIITDISSSTVSDFDETQMFSHFDRKYLKVGIPMFDLSVKFPFSDEQRRIQYWNNLKMVQERNCMH